MIHTLLVAAFLPIVGPPAAAEDLTVLPPKINGVAPKDSMHHYLLGRVREALDRRDAEYEKLKTPEQLAAYQRRMREFFVAALGGFPERTPLGPKVVAKHDRDGYRVFYRWDDRVYSQIMAAAPGATIVLSVQLD